MKTFGLIGRQLQHSFSPSYFEQKFQQEGIKDCIYKLFPLAQIEDFKTLLAHEPNLKGLNVTIPYKQAILPFLDGLSSQAQKVGAVNTIQIQQGKLIGHNTDVYGFQASLEQQLSPLQRQSKALVLGTGGASKAVIYALKELNIPYQLVSRTAKENVLTYDDLTTSVIHSHLIIINTTPLGMSPNIHRFPPLPYEAIKKQHLLFDLIYNPKQTLFMQKGTKKGATVINGLQMLHLQADRAWEIWTH
ncbi:shikimate dehydrogenase family protein [Aureispira anguillae]|uniref:Shikimate dehydrogenase n=1 Tax=Aureispira anguillae TaxID=2864201 RepID=A0A915YJS6_9BACT|nr:shikimate dehydrogenase [Aureispira anguillae]BDS14118.1 shikimate dehydrogenase [Aureispira anguillae]